MSLSDKRTKGRKLSVVLMGLSPKTFNLSTLFQIKKKKIDQMVVCVPFNDLVLLKNIYYTMPNKRNNPLLIFLISCFSFAKWICKSTNWSHMSFRFKVQHKCYNVKLIQNKLVIWEISQVNAPLLTHFYLEELVKGPKIIR